MGDAKVTVFDEHGHPMPDYCGFYKEVAMFELHSFDQG
jgi:hypothetical protein